MYNSLKHNRQSIRLKGYDYTLPGYYFITICTQNRIHRFGKIIDGKMQLNAAGMIVANEWQKSSSIRPNIQIDEWIIMPNHFHAILHVRARCTRPNNSNSHPNNPNCTRPNDFISRPKNGRIQSAPADGPIHSAPADGQMHSTPADGPIHSAPADGQMHSTPADGIIQSATADDTGVIIGDIIRGFKSAVTKQFWQLPNRAGIKLWQRNYWEHIIRDENELFRIRHYIQQNPQKWGNDQLNGKTEISVMEESAPYGDNL